MAAQAEVGLILRHLHGLSAETDSASDHQLLNCFITTRDEEAFAALVRRHGGMVLGLCRRILGGHHDAEDVFQAAFLILARKAEFIRSRESVGGWLYRVAHRLALKARAAAARRRDRDSHGATMTPADPATELTTRELRLLVDEELQQLPDKYRVPVVLCHLEGRTQEEAARQLGWSKGTLRRRVGQGRELLRRRLLRRGLAPAVALAATLTAESASAAVSAELVEITTRAALNFAAGQVVMAGAERAATLAEGGLHSMFLSKIRGTTALLLLTVSLAAGMSLLARQALTARESVRQPPAVSTSPGSGKDKEAGTVAVSGRVLDPNGKPFPGARVYCFRNNLAHVGDGGIVWQKPNGKLAATVSGPDGRFRLRINKANHLAPYAGHSAFEATVAAVGAGHGPGWLWVGRPDQLKDITLQLVKDDVPVRGRVLDLEGRPVRGMTVRVLAIIANRREDLQSFVDFLKQGKDATRFWGFLDSSLDPGVVGLPQITTTDAAGRFRLSGPGRERVLALRFEGAAFETQVEYVLTRRGIASRTLRGRRQPTGAETLVLHGANFERVAAHSRQILGAVRDRDTGNPLAGVSIVGRVHGSRLHTAHTLTDSQGRYRLLGLPQGGSHYILAVPPEGMPYLPSSAEPAKPPGFEPIRLDFGLKRGVLIQGKVTDRATGKPVAARVRYFAFAENPHLKDFPGFRGSSAPGCVTRPDGTFTLVGLPGRGLLAAAAIQGREGRYLAGAGAERIKGARDGSFITDPYYCSVGHFNSLLEIAPQANARETSCAVVLDPGQTVRGHIVGPAGRPLSGSRIEGFGGLFDPFRLGPLPSSRFAIPRINPNSPRPFFFYHDRKKLGAVSLLQGGKATDVVVRLRPLATLTGRLLDSDGRPIAGGSLEGFAEAGQLNLRTPWGGVFSAPLDKQGRFRVELIAGVKCGASVVRNGRVLADKPLQNVLLRPGETKDLGDLTIKTGQ